MQCSKQRALRSGSRSSAVECSRQDASTIHINKKRGHIVRASCVAHLSQQFRCVRCSLRGHAARDRLGDLDAIDRSGQDSARVARAFAAGIQAVRVEAFAIVIYYSKRQGTCDKPFEPALCNWEFATGYFKPRAIHNPYQAGFDSPRVHSKA